MWILIILVVGGVLISGIVQVNQMKVVEKIQQRIFARYAFELSFKIPRLKLSETEGYHMPELVNRFLTLFLCKKAFPNCCLKSPWL